mgnify:CR=1 FL=1|jgi:hypothetical protein
MADAGFQLILTSPETGDGEGLRVAALRHHKKNNYLAAAG